MRDVLKNQARLFKDLGHPIRLGILQLLLREGRQCVSRMLPELKVPQPTLSRHLATLRGHGYLKEEREGAMVFYRVSDRRIRRVLSACGPAQGPKRQL